MGARERIVDGFMLSVCAVSNRYASPATSSGAGVSPFFGQPNGWNGEVMRVMQSTEIQARVPNEGARFSPNTPEQFAAFVKSEIAKWAPVVKASGARVD